MRRLAIIAATAAGIAVMLSPVLPAAAQAATSPIVIHEIYYNSPGPDRGSNTSLDAEWVQLYNRTGHAVTLTHWTLRDTARHIYTFGPYQLKAHGYVKIHTGRGINGPASRYWDHSWYIWNNTGDTGTLKNSGGATQSRCSYSDPRQRHAYTMC